MSEEDMMNRLAGRPVYAPGDRVVVHHRTIRHGTVVEDRPAQGGCLVETDGSVYGWTYGELSREGQPRIVFGDDRVNDQPGIGEVAYAIIDLDTYQSHMIGDEKREIMRIARVAKMRSKTEDALDGIRYRDTNGDRQ